MIINIDEFKETLELNRSEIEHNQSLTNEYLIDDIMSQLGYNKRRNKDVKRMFDKPIDWEVLSTGSPNLAVKVFALGDEIDSDEVQSAMEYCIGKLFSILVLTNGETLNVYRYNKVKREYTSVCEIKLTDELSELSESVLEAISNDGFNTGKIDEIISKLSVSPEKVRDTMLDNVGMLANQVAAWMGDSGNSFIEQCKTVIESLISDENSSNAEQSETVTASEVTEASNEEISELQTKLAEATDKVTEQSKEIEEQQKEIEEQQKEIEELKSAKEEQQKEIDTLKTSNDELKSKLDEQSKKLDETKEHEISTSEVEELNNKISSLSAEIAEKDTQISELETEINTKNTLIEAKEALINEKDAEINEKIAELEKANNNSETSSAGSAASQDEIDAYREQIQTISSKLADSEDKIKQLTKELEDANDKLNNISGAERQKATELINVIEDSSELPRSYVAVINTELLQYDALHTFVGRTLQKLYEIKSYEASQFIFNGDIFKIVQPAERNDLIMNNKAYDIKLDGIHEDEVLNKLRIVFSHFSDIVFECKKIGSLEVTERMTDESYSNVSADTGIKFDSIDDIDNSNESDVDLDNDNNTEDINFGDDSSEVSTEAGISLSKADGIDEQQSQKLHGIMCGQFLQLDDLIWGDEDTVFNTIKYIGSSSVNFNINMNNDDMSNERLFCKSLDAMLALAILNGQNNVLSLLRQTDLSQINNFIKLYTEEYASYPGATRINGTRYIVAGIESVKQVASVLADVGNNLGIDMSDMFVFFDTDTTSEQMLDTWGYNEAAIQLNEDTDVSGITDEKDAIAVLNGGIFNNLIITKNSLSVHEKVIGRTLMIKTKYFRHIMENPDNPGDDVALTVREMINEAVKMGRHDINFNCLGNVIGESYKLVSENINDVSDDAIQIEADGRVLYVSRLKNWQVPLSLIKVHTTLLANTAVAIKVEVNSEALNFYMNQFVVAEPSFSLAVESFTRYINSCIK